MAIYGFKENKCKKEIAGDITTGEEFKTGRIVNGKEEFGIRVTANSLVQGNTEIQTGLTNVTFERLEAYITSSTIFSIIPFGYSSQGDIYIYVNPTNGVVIIRATDDSRTDSKATVYVYYTKN